MKKLGRPKGTNNKISTTLRLDSDIIHAFKKEGPGWQTRMNDALVKYVEQQKEI